jgi:N-carbamoylputrescine amidase
MSTVHVGLAQVACSPLDREANLVTTVRAVEEAAGLGADVVVLPELASSGYVLDETMLRPLAESVTDPGPALTAWADVARRTGSTVVGGFPELADDGRLFNSAAVFSPEGDLLGTYRKLHLFAGEVGVFAAGDTGLPVFEVGGLRLGVLICFDLRFPEAMRILAVRGVDVVAVPTAWVGGFDRDRRAEPDIGQVRTARVLANLNATPIACAGQVGGAGPFEFLGSSVLVDAFGQDVAPPQSRGEEATVVLELDRGSLVLARDRGDGMSPLSQRRTDVYDELLGHRPGQRNELGVTR